MVMLTGNSSVLPAGSDSSSPITPQTPGCLLSSRSNPCQSDPRLTGKQTMPPELEARRWFGALVRELYWFYVPSSSLFLFSFAS